MCIRDRTETTKISTKIHKLICKKSICITTKPDSIGIYFSHIDINEFITYLLIFEYPIEFIEYISLNRSSYSHLLFDVGYNFRINKNNEPVYTKSSVYFVF